MAKIFTIPNEVLNEITSYLNPHDTSRLCTTCRTLSSRLAPAMLYHAAAPKHGMHALHWAAERGHLPLLRQLVPLFPIDLPGNDAMTALQLAVRASHGPPVLQHLLANGANPNHIDALGRTALTHACEATTKDWAAAHQAFRAPRGTSASAEATIRLLIAHGANPHTDTAHDRGPLMSAMTSNLLPAARMMLDAGCDPNRTLPNGTPILVWAVYGGLVEWVELFLEYGADANTTRPDGTCVLMLAAGVGPPAVLKALIGHGADLRCVNNDGDTPLIHAMSAELSYVAEYLAGVEGVDLTGRGRYGLAPIHLAAQIPCVSVLRILLEKGCPVDVVDRYGSTALGIADRRRFVPVVRILLDGGATGATPFSQSELNRTAAGRGCASELVRVFGNGWKCVVAVVRGQKG